MHLTIGIFGNQELAKSLGKKGTDNDITIYNHASSEGVFTYVCPNSEKIQSLLQVLNMIDVPVLVVENLTKEIGEIIVGLDEMNFENGFIITKIREQIEPVIKNTSLEKYKIIDEEKLRAELLNLKIERDNDFLLVPIDNYFKVTGVGTIALGIVKSGTIKKYDKVFLEPLGKEVTVKGIQSQDKDFEEAGAGMRVGLNLKGVETDELKRGFVICKEIQKSSEISIKFTKNRFTKQELKEGMNILLSVGLQVVACSILSVKEELKLKSSQTVAFRKNSRCILALPIETYPRIVGSGNIS
jgi:selenocysteine-specific translation elongation factor